MLQKCCCWHVSGKGTLEETLSAAAAFRRQHALPAAAAAGLAADVTVGGLAVGVAAAAR